MGSYVDEMLSSYIECALWASIDENDNPLDSLYSIDDLHQSALAQMREDVARFEATQRTLLLRAGRPAQNGHDLWLTRNHHGAGFWDRGYSETIGNRLTEAAEALGEAYLYVGGDGMIYHD